MAYDRIADLPLTIETVSLERRERETSSGFVRVTTTISLSGPGAEGAPVTGLGEDVTYAAEEHDALHDRGLPDLIGEYTVDSFSSHVGSLELFPAGGPESDAFENYRRWALESAALDLALRQAETDIASVLERELEPVRFVASTRLEERTEPDEQTDHSAGSEQTDHSAGGEQTDYSAGERADVRLSTERFDTLRERVPDLQFKLDPTPDWDEALIESLAATAAVCILDLKGQYEGTSVDVPADPELYAIVLDGFPDAVIEDPALTDATRSLFDDPDVRDRISWDAPIHGLEDLRALRWEPAWLNVKPSRFGSIESLLETIEYCTERGISLYGGGQFELGVGRGQIQLLASLYYPDGPNDVAPRAYNDPEVAETLPSSPLEPPEESVGFRW